MSTKPMADEEIDAADREAIGRVVRMLDARDNLIAVKRKNARRGASQEACDEVNRAGFAWQAAWEAITDADRARMGRMSGVETP